MEMELFRRIERKPTPADRIFKFQGARLHYCRIGKGTPVVLLHGSMNADPWNGFEKKLSHNHSVYLPHLPGFGSSDTVNDRLHNTDLFTEAFIEFMKSVVPNNAPIVALSLGAVVAVKSVYRAGLNSRLVLVGLPLQVKGAGVSFASFIPVAIRRSVISTHWGRKHILLPILRNALGSKPNSEQDRKLITAIEATDTKSMVDLNVEKEINLQIPFLLKQIPNRKSFVYGSNDSLAKTAKQHIDPILYVEGAGHNIFANQNEGVYRLIKTLIT